MPEASVDGNRRRWASGAVTQQSVETFAASAEIRRPPPLLATTGYARTWSGPLDKRGAA